MARVRQHVEHAERELVADAGRSQAELNLDNAGAMSEHLSPGSVNPDRATSSTIGRAAQLLKALRTGTDGVGASELARRTGLPKSSVHRLLHEMVRVGLLERTNDVYRPALLLFEIGQAATRGRGLQEAARSHLSVLADATGHNVTLAVVKDSDVVYLDMVRASGGPRLPQRIGDRWPAHASAAGKAILAFSAPTGGAPVLPTRLRRLSDRTITDPETLAKELGRIAHHGVAYDRGESFPNIVGVAAPVMVAGQAVAAVAVSDVVGRMGLSRIDASVRATALAVSRALGQGD